MQQDITTNFGWWEFECHCGHCEMPEEVRREVEHLVRTYLQPLRDRLGKPIIIVSGYRCPSHNKAVGGARRSQHMYGRAADIKVPGMSPPQVHAAILDMWPDIGGLGLYRTWVHIDCRPNGPARWYG